MPIGLVLVFTLTLASLHARQRPALGTVSFPNSGKPQAQAAFLRGVAWLHSFGYEEAIASFRAAQKADPGFAMAYWGEAMSFNQPLWFHEDVAAGKAVLMKLAPTPEARAARSVTARERGYLAAVEGLWGPGDKRVRDQRYVAAMAAVVAASPQDEEAKLFHVLGLLAMLPRGDQALPTRQKAGAIAETVFARHPDHPGAAHYILHAYDHGTLAARALPAARAYATIAPSASHALHMPAHAFVQLGLWHEAAAADEASWNASIEWATRRKLSVAMRDYHSLSWLHYEWTQQGRFQKAREALALIDAAMKAMQSTDTVGGQHYADSDIGRGSGPSALRNDRGSMRARFVIESGRWTEMQGQPSFDNIDELFALGFSAAKLGDRARVEAAIEMLQKASGPQQDAGLREQAAIMLEEMQSLHLFAQGKQIEAFAGMERAVALQARMPRPIGRPYPVKGADELYAELLLEAGRPAAAVEWFTKTLSRTPNRSRALLGLARAQVKAGNTVGSRRTYGLLLENWRFADAGLPELAEAKASQ